MLKEPPITRRMRPSCAKRLMPEPFRLATMTGWITVRSRGCPCWRYRASIPWRTASGSSTERQPHSATVAPSGMSCAASGDVMILGAIPGIPSPLPPSKFRILDFGFRIVGVGLVGLAQAGPRPQDLQQKVVAPDQLVIRVPARVLVVAAMQEHTSWAPVVLVERGQIPRDHRRKQRLGPVPRSLAPDRILGVLRQDHEPRTGDSRGRRIPGNIRLRRVIEAVERNRVIACAPEIIGRRPVGHLQEALLPRRAVGRSEPVDAPGLSPGPASVRPRPLVRLLLRHASRAGIEVGGLDDPPVLLDVP